jgi:aminopeptidase N
MLASGAQVGTEHWHAAAVRDFTLAIGRFALVHATVDLPNPVRITLAVEHKSFTFPAKFLAAAVAALRSYSARYGPYPWSTYTLVVMRDFTSLAGNEYPTLVYLSPDGLHLVAHETAHQWFYSLVGNDQGRDPWLDEGLASWAETTVEPTQSLQSFSEIAIPADGKGQLGQSMPYWDSLPFQDYYDGAYVQAVQALASLGTPQQVDCALRLYVQQNAYGIATPDTLLAALQRFFPDARQTLAAYGAIF